MTCRKTRLFSCLLLVLCGINAGWVAAGERDDLYKSGKAAFEQEDYTTALKNLYAYYVLNKAAIEAKPDFKTQLLDKITNAESILKVAFAANPSIHRDGNRLRIITQTEGGPFIGEGKDIGDLLNRNEINLEAIKELNHKPLEP